MANLNELENLSVMAINAAKSANSVIMQNYSKFEVFIKPDKSPVTSADLAANEIITKHLQHTDIPICSEESILDESVRVNANRFWLIDPLDGTREFIAQNGEFCVCIALIEDGVPILGVIGVPVSGDIFCGFGGKVFKNGVEFESFEAKKIALAGRMSKSKRNTAISNTLNLELLQVGSAIKFTLIASGMAGVYARFRPSSLWDIAAGDALVRNSGGMVIDLQTASEPLYNGKSLLNNDLLILHRDFIGKKDEILEVLENYKKYL